MPTTDSDPRRQPPRSAPSSSQDWLRGFGLGKQRGARLHADYGPYRMPEPPPRDQLRIALNAMIRQTALGGSAGPEEREQLRRLAVHHAAEDWDGTALAAVAYLADRYQDRAARAWLQVMLAGAGHYREAVDLEPVWDRGRPAASAYVILVTAYAMLGQEALAHRFLGMLGDRFPGLRDEFVSVWDDTPAGHELDRLVSRDLCGEALPSFLHLPFCGGTSMISSLKQTVPWSVIIDVARRYGLYQIERAQALDHEQARRMRLVHLHHPFPIAVAGRELSHFTVLRDPVSQLASGYYKRRESPHIVATSDTDSATFADHADYTIRNGLTNMLARQIVVLHPELAGAYRRRYRGPGAFVTTTVEEQMFWLEVTAGMDDRTLLRMTRETLDNRFHLVGTMSHLAASHLAGAASVGLPVVQRIVHQGRSGQPRSGPDQALASRLRSANSVDQTLYEEYTERFERDYAGLITAVEDPGHAASASGAGLSESERAEQLRDSVAAIN